MYKRMPIALLLGSTAVICKKMLSIALLLGSTAFILETSGINARGNQ
jgi:hypothetical protein